MPKTPVSCPVPSSKRTDVKIYIDTSGTLTVDGFLTPKEEKQLAEALGSLVQTRYEMCG